MFGIDLKKPMLVFNMDHEYYLGRIFLKNGYLFSSKLLRKGVFFADLKKLFKKWPSSYRNVSINCAWRYKNLKDIKMQNDKMYRQRIEFIEKIEKSNKLLKFYDDINLFIKKHKLGEEWFLTMADYIISSWICPPFHNLDIRNHKKRIVLELNPDTSLDDIKSVWGEIKKQQKELWPSFRKINFTKKSFKNLSIVVLDMERKNNKDNKKVDLVEDKEYKISDLDIASEIWNDAEDITKEADEKRVSKLRQARKRFRDKYA